MLLSRLASFLFEQVAQVARRQVQLAGHVADTGYAQFTGLFGLVICVQVALKPGDHIAVEVAAGVELPVIKAEAVVQQQLNVRDDQVLAMAVEV